MAPVACITCPARFSSAEPFNWACVVPTCSGALPPVCLAGLPLGVSLRGGTQHEGKRKQRCLRTRVVLLLCRGCVQCSCTWTRSRAKALQAAPTVHI